MGKLACLSTDVSPEAVLEMAKGWGATELLIIGLNEDGEILIGGSQISLRDIAYLMRLADIEINNQITG